MKYRNPKPNELNMELLLAAKAFHERNGQVDKFTDEVVRPLLADVDVNAIRLAALSYVLLANGLKHLADELEGERALKAMEN